MIYARKIYKIPEFYTISARKMPEFYIIIARKIFFLNFRGHVPPAPVSYAYEPCEFIMNNVLYLVGLTVAAGRSALRAKMHVFAKLANLWKSLLTNNVVDTMKQTERKKERKKEMKYVAKVWHKT